MPRLLVVLLAVLLVVLGLLLAAACRAGRARTTGGAEGPFVTWDGPGGCLPAALVAESLEVVRGLPGFGPVTPAERAELAAAATRLGAKHRTPLRAEQLVALRRLEVALAAQYRGALAAKYRGRIATDYAAGASVLAIAARRNLPPMAVLRQVLAASGYGAPATKKAIADPRLMPLRLAAESTAIYEADLGSRLNADRVRAASQAFEDAVGAHLRGLGLEFATEEELRRAAAPGAPLLTPDFLLTRAATFGQHRVAWLDAKDYPAVDSGLVAASLARQAAKYTAAYGPGAFVFSGGVMCDSKTEKLGALVLDGSHIRPAPA